VNKILVIGVGFRPLEKEAKKALIASDVVLANDRLLDVFKNYEEYESVKDRILVHGSVYETLDYVGDNYKRKKICLLAAGDPMFFGIGRLIVERFGLDEVEIYPDLSSVQVAFSRIKEPSSNALFMSLHGGPDPEKRRRLEYELADISGLLNHHKKIAILTDRVNNPAVIANEMLKPSAVTKGEATSHLQDIRMYVCEKLGYPDEKITEGVPEEIAHRSFEHPNVVIIVKSTQSDVSDAVGARLPRPYDCFGLRESEIEHSGGLITKDEVRAVSLHKLRLPPKGTLWDIGAGSGSVSLEGARLCPELKVYAIERSKEQRSNICVNMERLNISNVNVIADEAPAGLKDLPVPDRVFIGGSGGRLADIISLTGNVMAKGIVVINAATIETLNDAVHCLEENSFTVEVTEVSVARSKTIGQKRHMSALNPIFIITGEKT
jgi:precorrin-6Y C5,15-methyltransferase (decarboxylating)